MGDLRLLRELSCCRMCIIIAVATIEADEVIASSDFLKSWVFLPPKGVNRVDSGQF